MIAAQKVPDLDGLTIDTAEAMIKDAGFEFHHETRGGYREYRHRDGSGIWIRPSGEVVRLGPRNGKYRQRYNSDGNQTDRHSTGETIKKDR